MNAFGQLASVTRNGQTTTFGYDGFRRRVRKSGPQGVRRYVYDGDNLFMELDGAGTLIREYTYYPGVDNPHSVRQGGQTYYYLMEAPGHVAGLVNSQGQTVSRYKYNPWGELESVQDALDQPLRYTAREYDSETGLYFYRARYYDPSLRRFISEDPIGLAGGINTYAYVSNDPINATDPFGLCPKGMVCLDNLLVTAPEGCTNPAWTRGEDGRCRSARGGANGWVNIEGRGPGGNWGVPIDVAAQADRHRRMKRCWKRTAVAGLSLAMEFPVAQGVRLSARGARHAGTWYFRRSADAAVKSIGRGRKYKSGINRGVAAMSAGGEEVFFGWVAGLNDNIATAVLFGDIDDPFYASLPIGGTWDAVDDAIGDCADV